MKLFTRVPLNLKLFWSGLIPILALLYFFYLIYQQKQLQIADTANFISRLEVSSKVNGLLEDLQHERRESINKAVGKEVNERLKTERDQVDLAIEGVEAIAGRELFKNYRSFLICLDSLGLKRLDVNFDKKHDKKCASFFFRLSIV